MNINHPHQAARTETGGGQPSGERGSTIPLMIGFFIIAGLMLAAGVVASAAFVQLRALQSACDGAAVAATSAFGRGDSTLDHLTFDAQGARQAVAQYAVQVWGADASRVSIDVRLVDEKVVVQCSRTAHVPFEDVFSPGGIKQTVSASSRAPVDG